MSASTKVWLNNNPPACEDDDLNGFAQENNNLIVGSGQALNTSDNQQTHKAVATYASVGDSYQDSGIADAYVLSPVGSRVAPTTYLDRMSFRFTPDNTNTGPSTVNIGGLGVKSLKIAGGDLVAGDLVVGKEVVIVYDSVNDWFSVVEFNSNVSTLAALQKRDGIIDGQTVYMTGRVFAGDGAEGPFYWDSSNLAAEVTADTQSALYVAPDSDPTGVNGAWVRAYTGAVNAKWAGAKGDGVADDTAALQALITLVLGTGGKIYIPDGTYILSSTLNIPLSSGWRINGRSRKGCILKQSADNTPIFSFANALTHSWRIESMTLSWSNQQTIVDTLSWGVYLNASGGSGFFLFNFDDIHIEKGHGFLGSNDAITVATWGWSIGYLSVGGDVSGQVIRLDPNPTIGQPAGTIDYLYIDAQGMGTLPYLELDGVNTTHIRVIEINYGGKGTFLTLGSGSLVIDVFRCESVAVTSDMAGLGLFDISNSSIQIGLLDLKFDSITLGGGNKMYVFSNFSAGKGSIRVDRFKNNIVSLVSGEVYFVSSTSKTAQARIGSLYDWDTTKWALTDIVATDGANYCSVDEWLIPRISADNGDADKTISLGDDEIIQLFNTTLTADRTVTMPVHNANPSNLFEGMTYRILRDASTPGAFILKIRTSAAGFLYDIPANTKGVVELVYERLQWRVVSFTTI